MSSLDALAWEAHRRGVSYGELVAHLTPGEEFDIKCRYKAHQDEKKFQAAKRAAEKAPPAKRRRKKKEA